MPELLLTIEPGDTPGNPPQTPPERQTEAHEHLELLLSGWERAVAEADVPPAYRQLVADTVERTRGAFKSGTTVYYLLTTVLASVFILPDEWEVAGLTEVLATEIGFDLDAARQQSRLYPSLFDETGKSSS